MKEPIHRLLDIMRALRDPNSGCAWDREQTFESIAPHTLEEAYELTEAINSQNAENRGSLILTTSLKEFPKN
jgi:ATP diphosphatase